jgi:ABC-2 type transport system ATP-binding protein
MGFRRYPRRPGRSRLGGMMTCSGVRYCYRGFEAVAGVDLDVGRGEIVALLGPNGAGKTTTVDLVLGQLRAAAGTVRVLGRDPVPARRELAPLVGVMPQESGFAPGLTVAETLRLWARLRSHRDPGSLGRVGLADRAGVRVRHLSGGERRRLDLAVALAGDPPLLVLDEPATGLDPDGREAAWALIRGRARAGAGVLVTTHHLEEAERYADRFVILRGGRVAARGNTGVAVAYREVTGR